MVCLHFPRSYIFPARSDPLFTFPFFVLALLTANEIKNFYSQMLFSKPPRTSDKFFPCSSSRSHFSLPHLIARPSLFSFRDFAMSHLKCPVNVSPLTEIEPYCNSVLRPSYSKREAVPIPLLGSPHSSDSRSKDLLGVRTLYSVSFDLAPPR